MISGAFQGNVVFISHSTLVGGTRTPVSGITVLQNILMIKKFSGRIQVRIAVMSSRLPASLRNCTRHTASRSPWPAACLAWPVCLSLWVFVCPCGKQRLPCRKWQWRGKTLNGSYKHHCSKPFPGSAASFPQRGGTWATSGMSIPVSLGFCSSPALALRRVPSARPSPSGLGPPPSGARRELSRGRNRRLACGKAELWLSPF